MTASVSVRARMIIEIMAKNQIQFCGGSSIMRWEADQYILYDPAQRRMFVINNKTAQIKSAYR